ncbi:putative inorganic phosphate cotransporter [Varroa jacobsoni]|uniref:putative inorganic phosphate cotransporter n=1 Tax=Varroa jacobsoni TaxID=62625 RepID=UPI000BF52EB1|nr:putative inorganic phosphate cotransporter [Varroa jacobsoni]XP_022707075.1 putative inorganic phosphate cotransporter [Varroa jacobsoni]XP_022707076.1 putative inorganic phosphate cotransporter [Varroa jacobsoni]XP_022707077.1 putative inorganic phosphate cotransporter [Varroa jacobsoni]
MTIEVSDHHLSKVQVDAKTVSSFSGNNKLSRTRRQTCWFQYRYALIVLSFFGLALVYGMRVSFNVALVGMVNQSAIAKGVQTGMCPKLQDSLVTTVNLQNESETYRTQHQVEEKKDGPFKWELYTQGIILGAFYYGYIITPIPGGRLAEKYGAKWVFGGGTLITGCLNLLIPVASVYAGSTGLIIVRMLQGLAEGVTYPAIEAQIAHWIPANQRATAVALTHTGGFFGIAIGMYVSGVLATSDIFGGWPSIFYIFEIWTTIWFVFWALLTSNRPEDHPWASQEEIDMILYNLGDQKPTHAAYTPWKKIFTSPAIFAVICAHFGTHWLQYILVTELPTYLGTVLNFNISDNGLYSSLPYMGAIIAGVFSGPLADWMRRRNFMTATNIRKLFNGLAHVVPSIMLICVVWVAGCDGGLSLVLFVIAGTIRGISEAGYMCIPLDMVPDYAGTVLGLCVCIGNTTGFIVPWVTGAFINVENSTTLWSYDFYVAGGVGLVTGLVFQLFASAEVQEWGIAPKDSSTEEQRASSRNDRYKPPRSADWKMVRTSPA